MQGLGQHGNVSPIACPMCRRQAAHRSGRRHRARQAVSCSDGNGAHMPNSSKSQQNPLNGTGPGPTGSTPISSNAVPSALEERIMSGEFTDTGSSKEQLSRPIRRALAKAPLGLGEQRTSLPTLHVLVRSGGSSSRAHAALHADLASTSADDDQASLICCLHLAVELPLCSVLQCRQRMLCISGQEVLKAECQQAAHAGHSES